MMVPMPVVPHDVAHLAREMTVWGKVPVYCYSEYILTAALSATQHEVSEDLVDELARVADEESRDLPPIDVADIDGAFVIVNGHHRAVAALRARQPTIWALVRRRATEPTR